MALSDPNLAQVFTPAMAVRWGLAELRKPDWAEWLRGQLQLGDPSRFRGKTYRRHLR
jgi:hypothetical protein